MIKRVRYQGFDDFCKHWMKFTNHVARNEMGRNIIIGRFGEGRMKELIQTMIQINNLIKQGPPRS
jgi:hypothetical protein